MISSEREREREREGQTDRQIAKQETDHGTDKIKGC